MISFKPYLHLEATSATSFTLTVRVPYDPDWTMPTGITVPSAVPGQDTRVITITASPNGSPPTSVCPATYTATINIQPYETNVKVEVYKSTDPGDVIGFTDLQFASVGINDPVDYPPCGFLSLIDGMYSLDVLTPLGASENIEFDNPPYGTLDENTRTFELVVNGDRAGHSCGLGENEISIPESEVGNDEEWVVLVKKDGSDKGKIYPDKNMPDPN